MFYRNRRALLLLISFLLVLLSGCYGFKGPDPDVLGIQYWPSHQPDSDEYVWINEDNTIFLINSEVVGGFVGLLKGESSVLPAHYSYGRYDGLWYLYIDEFIQQKESGDFATDSSTDSLVWINTKTAIFSENGFQMKIRNTDKSMLISSKKQITFQKYRREDVSPSQFGFEFERWSDIWSYIHVYYYIEWDDKWGQFAFDDYDGVSSEKMIRFKELLAEGKEEEAMKLVDAFGLQGQ